MSKKIQVILLGLLVLSVAGQTASAQTESGPSFRKHELSIGMGVLSVQEFLSFIGTVFTAIYEGQSVDDISGSGCISLSYRYHQSRRLSFGLTGVLEKIEVTYKNPTQVRSYNSMTLMGNVRFKYYDGPRFCLYSGVAAGWCWFGSGINTAAFHVTGLGMGLRLGPLGLYVEGGAGYQGLISAGLFCRF